MIISRMILHSCILIPIFALSMMGQSFQLEWDAINKELDSGNIKSAQPLLSALFTKAKAKRHMPMALKCIIHLAAISGNSGEPDDKSMIMTLAAYQDSVETAAEKALLHFFIAEAMRNYLQYEQEDIQRRPYEEHDIENLATIDSWHQDQIFKAIISRINAALSDSLILLSIPARTYEEILKVKDQSQVYRPTLYDLISYAAIALYEKLDAQLAKTHRPMITDQRILLPSQEFIKVQAANVKGYELEHGSVLRRVALYQSLLRNHAKDIDQTAYIEADIQRLIGLFSSYIAEAKDSLLISSLLLIHERNPKHSATANALFEAALHCINTEQRSQAAKLCSLIIATFPSTKAAEQSTIQLGRLQNKELNLTVQEFVQPLQPFIFKTEYANIDKIYCRIYRLTEELEKTIKKRRYRDTYLDNSGIATLLTMQSTQAWKQEFPKSADYSKHVIWKKAPALTKGRYIMLMSNSPIFDMSGDNIIVHAEFTASPMMSMIQRESNGTLLVHAIESEQGKPISATVHIVETVYNTEKGTYSDITTESYKTNNDGIATLPPIPDERQMRDRFIRIASSLDTIILNHTVLRFPTNEFRSVERIELFTDRQIYRPGHTIHVKGILYSHQAYDKAQVIPNRGITIRFNDARGKILDSMFVTSSAYGSCSASFNIPEELVTGFCSLQTDYGSITVRIEEYKRPQFEIQFSAIDTSYVLGDIVTIRGNAKHYAGNAMSGAQLSYTIHRVTTFPCWPSPWLPRPQVNDKEIAHGTGMLDGKGNFAITFPAIKDIDVNPLDAPMYSYSVNIDVIAGNGEVQQAHTMIDIGTLKAIYAFKHKEVYYTNEAKDIDLSCQLYSQKPAQGMRGTIIVESLPASNVLKLPLPFDFGDVQGLSDKDKELLFPNDLCDLKDSPIYKRASDTIYSSSLISDIHGLMQPKLPKLSPGHYRIRFLAENETIPFAMESMFSVIDITSEEMPIDEHLFAHVERKALKVGDTARLSIGSAWEQASILLQIESRGAIVIQRRLQCSRSIKHLDIPILPTYRGGITIHCTFAKKHRIINKSIAISIPWSESSIQIRASTFRDKTLPGSKERWTFSLDQEHISSEVMATVYDASLDALAIPQIFAFTNLWQSFGAIAEPSGLTTNTITASALFGERWNEQGNGYSELREFDEFNLDLLLGGLFGRTEVVYFSEMLASKSMMSARSTIYDHLSSEDKVESRSTPRLSMQELAFFTPSLPKVNNQFVLEAIMPEALTRWNVRLFAHDKDMSHGSFDTTIITQKQFMISSHVPRFVRQSDTIVIRASIAMLDINNRIEGTAKLSYYTDDDSLSVREIISPFTCDSANSGQVAWSVIIPKGKQLTCIMAAESDMMQDAERYSIPILPSTLPITDRHAIWLNPRVNTTKQFSLSQEKNNDVLFIQTTAQPQWYALEALPDLLDKSYGSSLDISHRLLAAHMAETMIMNNPSVMNVLRDSLLKGRLASNKEQSSFGISKTRMNPWEGDLQDQLQQSTHLSLYAEPTAIRELADLAFNQLQNIQLPSGGFPWFSSMGESTFITRSILIHLAYLAASKLSEADKRDRTFLIDRTITWLDEEFAKEINQAISSSPKVIDSFQLAFSDIHHAYARTLFLKTHPIPQESRMDIIKKSLWKERLLHGIQAEAMIALIFWRLGDSDKAKGMLRSLKERAIEDESGIHWTFKSRSWHDADIESHALILTAFEEINPDSYIKSGILTYILKQKQTRNWGTSTATWAAVHSLISQAEKCSDQTVQVSINGNSVPHIQSGFPGIASTMIRNATDIHNIEIAASNNCPVWGGIFRQRNAPLSESINSDDQSLSVQRTFLRLLPGKGLIPLKAGDSLSLGERIIIRLTINASQAVNYVHIQDYFPGCFDIMANNSEYRLFKRISAFAVPRDQSMNFFADYVPKGNSMVEYEVKVDKTGTFSKGMVKAYSMYAPEFGSTHGGGIIIVAP